MEKRKENSSKPEKSLILKKQKTNSINVTDTISYILEH